MKILLELDNIKILRKKHRWNIYFIVVADDPKDTSKKYLTIFPQDAQFGQGTQSTELPNPRLIRLRPLSKNHYSFVPEGDGDVDGLKILEIPMPANKSYAVELYVRHHRSVHIDFDKVIDKIKTETEAAANKLDPQVPEGAKQGATKLVDDILGKGLKWLPIAGNILHIVESVLANLPDRKMGMISLDEKFGHDFVKNTEQDRTNTTSTGEVELTWTWSIITEKGDTPL